MSREDRNHKGKVKQEMFELYAVIDVQNLNTHTHKKLNLKTYLAEIETLMLKTN